MTGLPGIRCYNLPELEKEIAGLGWPKFRAKQVIRWVHRKGVTRFSEMTDLPEEMRVKLGKLFIIEEPVILEKKFSKDGETFKYLLEMPGGHAVESVLMKYRHGYSACLSTQVGCRMACMMCASGIGGLIRNLTAGEILGQIWSMQKDAGIRIGNVVLMGSGEPLDNYDATVKFIELATAPYGLNIGQRHITLSTCGIVPGIRKLMKLRLSITLAVSLHAPNNELRNRIMPVNRKYPLEELLPACKEYAKVTGRRVTFEYSLINGINDGREQARELVRVLKGIHCHINLIPANPVRDRGIGRSLPERTRVFRRVLEEAGYNVTLRREMGLDIDAACGQLKRRYLQRNENGAR